jgi:hypothetical protein
MSFASPALFGARSRHRNLRSQPRVTLQTFRVSVIQTPIYCRHRFVAIRLTNVLNSCTHWRRVILAAVQGTEKRQLLIGKIG